jgi:hypothetical protein
MGRNGSFTVSFGIDKMAYATSLRKRAASFSRSVLTFFGLRGFGYFLAHVDQELKAKTAENENGPRWHVTQFGFARN